VEHPAVRGRWSRPKPLPPVRTSGGKPLPVRTPSHAPHLAVAAFQSQQFLPAGCVPHLRRPIPTPVASRFPSGLAIRRGLGSYILIDSSVAEKPVGLL